jgi:CubicO group peptidase (beta-lactamase class C family)
MTKLVTAVAVMQLVERGVVSLDDDVRERVPQLRNIQILQDMKPGTRISSLVLRVSPTTEDS